MSRDSRPSSIAVIISTYNAPQFLHLTLNGYAQQTDRNFSIYVADDGSGPDIAAVIATFKNLSDIPVYHIWHEDKGYRRAQIIDRAIVQVQEPYILLTDADCVPFAEMIATHKSMAGKGIFIRGSRILLSEKITRQLCKQGEWSPVMPLRQWALWRLQGRINRLLPLLLPIGTSRSSQKLPGIRGCHFAFWKNDIFNINGFDGSYEGWGREDSDLAARFFHSGIRRKNLRGMPVLHLWHAEASRRQLAENDALLQECLHKKRTRACIGIAELTSA